MQTETFFINGYIPAILYGQPKDQVFLFLHGQCGYKEEAADFAKIVCAKGYQVLSIDLPAHGARKTRDETLTPWAVEPELHEVMREIQHRWKSFSLRANSIAAYFALLFLPEPNNTLFVSPILDMEWLISQMMTWAGVSQALLEQQGQIETSFGQTLSWDYWCYARTHMLQHWSKPIHILYAKQDNMSSPQIIEQFSHHYNVRLTVMPQGEHWFHTPEQMRVLHQWEDRVTDEK